MTLAGFAWRSLTRDPARSLLGVAGIAVSGALLLDMLMLSRGLLISFHDLLEGTGYEVRVTATAALPGMGPPIEGASGAVEQIAKLPQVAEALPLRFGAAVAVEDDGSEHSLTTLGGTRRSGERTLLRGRDARDSGAEPEIVINENLARRLGVDLGGIVRLRPGQGERSAVMPTTRFEVVGVASFAFDQPTERTAAVTLQAFRDAALGVDQDEADLLLVRVAPGTAPEDAVSAIHSARPDLHPFSIADFLARFGARDFSYFRQISFVLSVLTGLFAFLLVATLLTVSVNQRLGEVAALRALGLGIWRVTAHLLFESLFLVGAGGLLSLPLGLVLARVLDDILKQMPGIPAALHFFVLEPRALAVHAGLLLITAAIAAAWPVHVVRTLPITATLRREVT